MPFLDSFEIYQKKDIRNIFISVTVYGITFSKSSVDCLDYPEYVHVFFDKNSLRMAVSPSVKDRNAKLFVKDKNSPRAGFVRWNDKVLTDYIINLANITLGEKGVRIKGEFISDENILVYNLTDYKPIKEKLNP